MTHDSERRTTEASQAAQRAGEYAQASVSHLRDRARDVARATGAHLERLIGHSLDGWTTQARTFVRDHPLRAVAVMVGLGYVLGKLLRR